ncbi:unnamed protein product [Symbiodinium natans]|uniref:Uncharacterized protein n=1 Tax=Symbiodinium natans TaxID=878477 RepID=A0A812UFL9_9DINO|nr:unnamed protein product [Symbiodinium natans]
MAVPAGVIAPIVPLAGLDQLKDDCERLLNESAMQYRGLQEILSDALALLPTETACLPIVRRIGIDIDTAKAPVVRMRLIEHCIGGVLLNNASLKTLEPQAGLNPLRLGSYATCLKTEDWPSPAGIGPSVGLAWLIVAYSAQAGMRIGAVQHGLPLALVTAQEGMVPLTIRTLQVRNWVIVSNHWQIGSEMILDGSLMAMPFFLALPESLMRSVVADGVIALDGFPCGQANAFTTIDQALVKLHQWCDQVPSIEAGLHENVWIIGYRPMMSRFPTVLKNPATGKGGLLHWHNQSYCGHCLILEAIEDGNYRLNPIELLTAMVVDTRLSLKALLDGLNWDLSGATEQFSFHCHIAVPTRLSKLIGAGCTAGIGSSAIAGSAVARAIGEGQIGSSELTIASGGSRLRIALNVHQMD